MKRQNLVLLGLAVSLVVIIFIAFSGEAIKFIETQKTKSEISSIMKNLDYEETTFLDDKKMYSDNEIIKIQINSDGDIFDVYLYNKSEIYAIVNSKNKKEIYSNKKRFMKNSEGNDIILLISGLFGSFGKMNIYDDTAILKYYIPSGKYKVRRLSLNSNMYKEVPYIFVQKKFYDDTKDENINKYEFPNDIFLEIDILDNTYLDISQNSIFEIQKIN